MSIKLHQVSVQPGKRSILKNVSLSFFHPLTYILGLNGSGKTTLLRTITGEIVYQGRVSVDDEDSSLLDPRKRALKMAVVRQRINLPFQLKVLDFVMMGRYAQLAWWGSYSKLDRKRVEEELERMSIQNLKSRNLDEISGGELQKVLLARALVQDSPWLLLDEPGQQLDPKKRKELYQLLVELSQEGKKIICSTHDREAVEQGASRVIGLKDGEVIYDEEKGNSWEKVWESIYA